MIQRKKRKRRQKGTQRKNEEKRKRKGKRKKKERNSKRAKELRRWIHPGKEVIQREKEGDDRKGHKEGERGKRKER